MKKSLKVKVKLISFITTFTVMSSILLPQIAEASNKCGSAEDMAMSMPANHPHAMGTGVTKTAVGYTLEILKTPMLNTDNTIKYRFTNKGKVVKDFTLDMGKVSHLIVYSSDYKTYIHTHPYVDQTGVFTSVLPIKSQGTYNFVTDTSVPLKDKSVNPSIQLLLGGSFNYGSKSNPIAMAKPKCSVISNGYKISLSDTEVKTSHGTLMVTISDLNGNPVNFGQFLGARAHLVVIKDKEHTYAHFHPMNADGSMPPMWGSDVNVAKSDPKKINASKSDIINKNDSMPGMLHFMTEPPGPGRYMAFMQFVDKGILKTVQFTLDAVN